MNDISIIYSNLFAMQRISKPEKAPFYLFILCLIEVQIAQLIIVASQSEGRTVIAHLNAGIVSSNLTQDVDVCV
jgi:hypothetical protein